MNPLHVLHAALPDFANSMTTIFVCLFVFVLVFALFWFVKSAASQESLEPGGEDRGSVYKNA